MHALPASELLPFAGRRVRWQVACSTRRSRSWSWSWSLAVSDGRNRYGSRDPRARPAAPGGGAGVVSERPLLHLLGLFEVGKACYVGNFFGRSPRRQYRGQAAARMRPRSLSAWTKDPLEPVPNVPSSKAEGQDHQPERFGHAASAAPAQDQHSGCQAGCQRRPSPWFAADSVGSLRCLRPLFCGIFELARLVANWTLRCWQCGERCGLRSHGR
jgi:hypothetical protein